MYAFLQGILEDHGPPTVIRVGGVGYEVWVPQRTRVRLPPRGEELRLYTHLQGREDGMSLFGFGTAQQREFFRTLIGVNGVGPKLALAILGDENAEAILASVRRGDPRLMVAVKGVGKKTAERLVVELKDKEIDGFDTGSAVVAEPGSPEDEATMALEAIGLRPEDARAAVSALDPTSRGLGVEEIVRRALRRVATA